MLGRRDVLEKAVRRFNRGEVDAAAWMLWDERVHAARSNDAERLAEIDDVTAEMRQQLAGDERLAAFDAHVAGREDSTVDLGHIGPAPFSGAHPTAPEELVDVTPLSLGIALVGAGITLLAVFLPQFESNTFARIEKNTLIQNGDGWWFIIVAVLAAGAAYRAYSGHKRTFGPVVFGVIAIGLAVYYGTSHSQRRLCSVAGSSLFGSTCTLASPGVGIYAAGVGGLLLLIGGWQMFRAPAVAADEPVEPQAVAPSAAAVGAPATIADRLRMLDQLMADGLITDGEYAQRRSALLEQV